MNQKFIVDTYKCYFILIGKVRKNMKQYSLRKKTMKCFYRLLIYKNLKVEALFFLGN